MKWLKRLWCGVVGHKWEFVHYDINWSPVPYYYFCVRCEQEATEYEDIGDTFRRLVRGSCMAQMALADGAPRPKR